MSTTEMDPVFASALRAALVHQVEATPRRRRHWRWRVGLGVLTGSVVVAGGAALAAGLLSQPGAPVDTLLGNPVSVTRTGTATIDLGPAPAGATNVSLTLTCLSAATFYFPDGSSASCTPADLRHPPPDDRQTEEVVPLAPGQHTVTIKTSPGASWALQAAYINRVISPWATNALGETYGVVNQHGSPDLVAVVIDDGKIEGYAKASDLDCASGLYAVHSPAQALAWDQASAHRNISVPVYKSDGTTVIGTFVVGHAGPEARTVPLSSLSLGCGPATTSAAPPSSSSSPPSTVSPGFVTTVEIPATKSPG
jgi:hypothetical protein